MGIDEGMLHLVIDEAQRTGAEYAEARYHRRVDWEILSRQGKIIAVGKSISEGVGIRVIVNGVLAFSATNDLTREGILRALNNALSEAKAHSKHMINPIEFAETRVGRVRYDVKPIKRFDDAPVEEKISLVKEAWNRACKGVKEAKVASLLIGYGEFIEEKLIVNSDGAYIYSVIPRLRLEYNIVLHHPQKGTIQRFNMLGASGGIEWLKKWRMPDLLTDETRSVEHVLIKGVEPPKEKVDIVLGPEVVGLIVHESCGHPSEADRILGREAAQAGKSFIKPDMIGTKIGNEYATVIDDPTIPGSYGFYLYDDEGVPARARYLYKEGLINEFLHNRWTAKILGVESNASARAMDYNSEPIIRMANTYLKPGDYTFEELIEDIKLGVYIKNYMEWNIDDTRWSQRYVGLESYIIRNGELCEPVRNPILEITTKSFYSNIDAVDRNLEFVAGTCGKGEPAQGMPVWFGGPNVKLKNIPLRVMSI